MMHRVAVFVDAGYLFAAGGEALSGSTLKRVELRLDHDVLLAKLIKLARMASGDLPLLRIYWYDGTSGRQSTSQTAVGNCENVKLRLGLLNSSGEQKGVDSLIITDMIALARNGAMADALLVSGDEDVRVGVQQAQERGVRVYLLGVDSGRFNQSPTLQQEADGVYRWDKADVQTFLTHIPPIAVAPGTIETSKHPIDVESAAQSVAIAIPSDQIDAVLQSVRSGSIPPEWDARLLAAGRTHLLENPLLPETKRELRKAFRTFVKAQKAG